MQLQHTPQMQPGTKQEPHCEATKCLRTSLPRKQTLPGQLETLRLPHQQLDRCPRGAQDQGCTSTLVA